MRTLGMKRGAKSKPEAEARKRYKNGMFLAYASGYE